MTSLTWSTQSEHFEDWDERSRRSLLLEMVLERGIKQTQIAVPFHIRQSNNPHQHSLEQRLKRHTNHELFQKQTTPRICSYSKDWSLSNMQFSYTIAALAFFTCNTVVAGPVPAAKQDLSLASSQWVESVD